MEITSDNTLGFNWKLGIALGVDVEGIFNHPLPKKYRVTAYPHVNVREEPSANSKDIGDKVYLEIVSGWDSKEGWLKLANEPGWVSTSWLEEMS